MDEKIEITEKSVRQSAGQETAFVNMLNDEMELLILSLGYRKESDTARDVIGDLAELIINHSGRLNLEDLYEIAEKYGVKGE